ncbi:hypothetical protein [Streptomyces sp. HB2AG]|uniref:hypothetical protein n=1 Tax=Streptomyces sp. HB2AG TaxID=2983400 RepID=UPI0022AAE886|nr:hypothetical protein [Streptomyces sp. HB2AG]MCZ2525594.1 hypothetical protein [Streptomyces sp. HB2AG]
MSGHVPAPDGGAPGGGTPGSGAPGGGAPGGGGRRRWVTWLVVAVLVLGPATYFVISAVQSRESGRDKQQAAAATGMTTGWPTKLQRRIYEVPLPAGSTGAAFLETNSWETSSLYVRFNTGPGGLDSFLGRIGTSRSSLRPGAGAVDAGQRRTAGWTLEDAPGVYGTEVEQDGDRPDHDVVVDLRNERRPTVYVVSTVDM